MKYFCILITYLSISSAAPSLEANTRDHRRIVGGDEAAIENFPYIGSILLNRKQHICGSALINNDTVVTAAHCVHGFNITGLSVRFGSSRWSRGGQELFVKQVTTHEEYYPWYHPTFLSDYDIAVVKLNGRVNVANAVPTSILLAEKSRQYKTGTPGVVSGWGMTEDGSYPETLRKVEVPVYDHTQCRHISRENIYISDRMICAGYKKGGKNSCSGDSGGPYVIKGELAGIVSFGNCDLIVYASIPAFHDWIQRHA